MPTWTCCFWGRSSGAGGDEPVDEQMGGSSSSTAARRGGAPDGRAEADVDTIFFDLDGTLYPNTSGFQASQMTNLCEFVQLLGFPKGSDASAVIHQLMRKYDESVLKALRSTEAPWRLKAFDSETMYQFVRKDGERLLRADPELESVMRMLPQRKFLFTNTHEASARHTLGFLGLDTSVFEGIIGAVATNNIMKPSEKAFEAALRTAGRLEQPCRCVMFEDSPKNLATARRLGMRTVLVSKAGFGHVEAREVDARIPSISATTLRGACPWLEIAEAAPD